MESYDMFFVLQQKEGGVKFDVSMCVSVPL